MPPPSWAPPPPALQQVEVKGASAAYDPRRDDTAGKSVVGSEEILRYGDTSVIDVFKRLPGITVSGAAIRMRGLGAGYTQILLNGERAPAGFSIDSLAPDDIERIEILRAASAEFSTQSIAGTINIVLKKTIRNAQRQLKLTQAGSAVYRRSFGNLQLSDRDGALSYSLSASAYRHEFDQQAATVESGAAADGEATLLRHGAGQLAGRNAGLNLAPRLNWALQNGDTVTLQSFVGLNRGNNRGEDRVDTALGRPPTRRKRTGAAGAAATCATT